MPKKPLDDQPLYAKVPAACGGGRITPKCRPSTVVTVLSNSQNVVTIGTQGPPGPPGQGATIMGLAGVPITAFQAVVMIEGLFYPADPTNVDHASVFAGITTNSGSGDTVINVATSGEIDGLEALSGRYYVGLAGTISNNVIAAQATWLKSLGYAKSDTALILLPGPSVIL